MTRKGFTLLEVLVVVMIAAVVTMFAVPAYKKAQDKNRFMAATGVLVDLANGAKMYRESYPDRKISSARVTGQSGENAYVSQMRREKFFSSFPMENRTYMGFAFYVSTEKKAICSGCNNGSPSAACMVATGSNSYKVCAWVDESGMLFESN